MSRTLDVTTSWIASVLSLGAGLTASAPSSRPAEGLVLYEFEACPFCRRVRAALSELDLEAEIRPCPKGGERFRPEVVRRGGKAQFPFLVDPSTGAELYESAAIVAYLYDRYGDGRPPLVLGPAGLLPLQLAGAARGLSGVRARPSAAPAKPLELWSFEASPYCRLVRETLCELELPYRLHNVAKHSPSRRAFVARSGKMQVPYLVDPNTGEARFESAEIQAYLRRTYGA